MQYHNKKFDFYTTTTTSWEAMLEACAQAQTEICLEEFILNPDEIGRKFVSVLSEKAKSGLQVRVLLDWWGCRAFKGSVEHHKLIQGGAYVEFFREPSTSWLQGFQEIFPRDHRKLLIVDQQVVFVGGVCIYDDIINWRDTMVRLEGVLVPQFIHIFDQTWKKTLHEKPEIKAHPEFETCDQFSVYANAPDSDEYNFTEAFIGKINKAKKSISLTTPYFTPIPKLMDALEAALERGVSVEIILSNYSKYAPYVVGKYMAGELIRKGAKIYYYEPIMIHLKMMVIDDDWSAIGSCNLDGLSIHQNQEVMLISTEENFTKILKGHFSEDKENSVRFSYADWQARPILQKISGTILYPFRFYL